MPLEPETPPRSASRSALVAALSVYAEPLVSGARVLLIGEALPELWSHLLDMGASSVLVLDPDAQRARRVAALAPRGVTVRPDPDFTVDVRDAAFDLALLTDIARIDDPGEVVGRLRRALDRGGAVVALGRARGDGDDPCPFPELAAPVLDYEELYDLFAVTFEQVTMTGVLPFSGVTFAELGESPDDVAVSVDTRLAPEGAQPTTFVVVAGREARALDPYAIVQADRVDPKPRDASSEAAFAAMQLRAALLSSQLDEMRGRVTHAEAAPRSARVLHESENEIGRLRAVEGELTAALTRVALERDAALVKVVELEAATARLADVASILERRVLGAEQSMSERESALVAAHGELEHIAVQHAAELLELEERLQERARTVADHEREIGRREELVRDLVGRLEELREGSTSAAPPELVEEKPAAPVAQVAVLEQKLDALALDVARRESEIVARGWKVRELEATLARAHTEVDALRQALAQEHSARLEAQGPQTASSGRASGATSVEDQGGG